jgi:hypothetical protein
MDQPDQLFEGMDVYDVDGEKVGKVVRYEERLGYFETEGTFSGPRYIPFWAIEKVGPSGTYLNVPKDVVSHVYRHMPAVKPELTPEGKLAGTGTVQSGWTGQMVPLDADGLKLVKERIHIGASVFDSDHKDLGAIQDYDPKSGYMRIEKAAFTVKDVFLPVTSIAYLDDEGVHLSELKDTIMNRFSRVPQVAREFFAR